MNAEKLKRLQAQVRIGGKGTPRRKKKVMHQTATTDDKKLQSSLKKLSVSTIPGIEEVNIIKDDLTVIHFNNPKAQASLSANTFAVTGHGESKKIVEMLPEILPQLGQETVVQLRMFANSMSGNQKQGGATASSGVVQNVLGSVVEEDDVPMLVSDFDEVAKMEAVSTTAQTPMQVVATIAESSAEVAKPQEKKSETATNIVNEKQNVDSNLNAKLAVKLDAANKPTDKADSKTKDDKKQKKQKDKPEAKAAEKPKNDAKVSKKPAEQKAKGSEVKTGSDKFSQPVEPVFTTVESQQDLKTEKVNKSEVQVPIENITAKITEAPVKPKAEKQVKTGSENKPSPVKQDKQPTKDAKAEVSKTATEKCAKNTEEGNREDNKKLQKERPTEDKLTTPIQIAVATNPVESPKETSVEKKEATVIVEPSKDTIVEEKKVMPTVGPLKETPVGKIEAFPNVEPLRETLVAKREATPTATVPCGIQIEQVISDVKTSEAPLVIETGLDTKKDEPVGEAPVKLEVKLAIDIEKNADTIAVTPQSAPLAPTTAELKMEINVENQIIEEPKSAAQPHTEPKENIKVAPLISPEIKEVQIASMPVTAPIIENTENKSLESAIMTNEQLTNIESPAQVTENKETPVAEKKIENQIVDLPAPLKHDQKVEKQATVKCGTANEAEAVTRIVSADAKATAELEKPLQQPAAQLQSAALQVESAQIQKAEIKSGSTTPTVATPKQKVSPPKQSGNNKKSTPTTPEAGKQQLTKSTAASEATAKPAAQSDAKKTEVTKQKQSSSTKPQQQQQKPQQVTAKSAPTTPTKTPDKSMLAPKPTTAGKSASLAEGAKKANSPQKPQHEGAAKTKQAGAKNRPTASANAQTLPKAAQPTAPKSTAAAVKSGAEIADKKPGVAPATPTTAPATDQAPAAPK